MEYKYENGHIVPINNSVSKERLDRLEEVVKTLIPEGDVLTKEDIAAVATTANNALKMANNTSTELSTFKTNISNTYATKLSLSSYVKSSVLDNYATTADVSAKADKSELANYATTEALAQKADASALNDKADKSAFENYATKESLANFATKEEVKQMTETTASIAPNILYVWGEVASLNLTLADGEEDIVNEYMVQFTSGATATTLTLPDSIVWMSAPNIQANKVYQVSIINNLGVIGEFGHE